MRKLTILYTVLLLVLPFIIYGQSTKTPWQSVSTASNSFKSKLSGKTYIIPYTSNGTHFYHHDFLLAKITLVNGEVFEDVRVRYNSYLDELVCFNPNLNSLYTIDKFIVKEFELTSPIHGNQQFVKLKWKDYRSDERYFNVLYDGDISLLVFYKTEEKKTSPYMDKTGYLKDVELVLEESFYILKNDSVLNKFTPKRKSFAELFPENKKQVKQILRKNKIYKYNSSNLIKAFSAFEDAGIVK